MNIPEAPKKDSDADFSVDDLVQDFEKNHPMTTNEDGELVPVAKEPTNTMQTQKTSSGDTPKTQKQDAQNPAPEKTSHASEVHTLYHDMDTVMHSGQTGTLAQVLRETQEKKEEARERSPFSPKNLVFIIGGILLLLGGIGVLVFALTAERDTTPERIEEFRLQTIVPSTTQIGLDIGGRTVFELRDQTRTLGQENITPRELQYIYFTTQTPTGNRLLTSREFFDAFEITIPQSLRQTLADQFMYGTYRTADNVSSYLVLQFDSFDRAFEGISTWENTLLRDLRFIFDIPSSLMTNAHMQKDFVDRIIQNVPTRILLEDERTNEEQVLVDEDVVLIPERFIDVDRRNILLVYSFINENTLVITQDPAVITEVRRRIREAQIFSE